jgi:hypothetical protein
MDLLESIDVSKICILTWKADALKSVTKENLKNAIIYLADKMVKYFAPVKDETNEQGFVWMEQTRAVFVKAVEDISKPSKTGKTTLLHFLDFHVKYWIEQGANDLSNVCLDLGSRLEKGDIMNKLSAVESNLSNMLVQIQNAGSSAADPESLRKIKF